MTDIDYWQKKHTKYANQEWILKPTIFATQVIKYFPKSGHILDLGAGQGQDTIFFAHKGYKVTACDFSEFALDLAKIRLPEDLDNLVEFKVLDLAEILPLDKQSFDIVYSHLALHYFDQKRTQELFDEIYKILKPGGIFATITNTIDDPEIPEFTKLEDDYYVNPDGLKKSYFSVDSIRKLTKKFKIILLDNKGSGHKETVNTLIRFIGQK